jgi:hypothetical protein
MDLRMCGYTASVAGGELQKVLPCSSCRAPMRPVVRKDGGHSWVCKKHGWFLADDGWEIVEAPRCPTCREPLLHRGRNDPKGEFFWACFKDGVFLDSDAFGRVRTLRFR